MKHYVGLDVSLKEVSICVVDADGAVAAESKVATEPSEILSWIEERIGAVERIVHESGPLSKRGNAAMRTLLFEAANVLTTRVRRFSPLKAWAVRLAARKGFKKAAVAAARKIAVVMLRLWRDGTTFAWTKEALPA